MEIKLILNEQEAQMILDALVKEPYLKVFNVVNKIQDQAMEQMKISAIPVQRKI